MKELKLNPRGNSSRIFIGGSIEQFKELIGERDTIILTDENLDGFYGHKFQGYKKIVIGTGESIKNLSTIEEIVHTMIELGADRNSFLLAVGGGVVCDIAGMVASIFMRGIDFGFVSTSLLSQVDASVGGKNGVNIRGFKNMVGLFNQPQFVICDHDLLSTLPREEYINGLGEVVKSACLGGDDFFSFLENQVLEILNMKSEEVHEMVSRSIVFKAGVVEQDERESGMRKILNLGHTIGHGLEKIKQIPHGFAIAAGMKAVAQISVQKGLLAHDSELRINSLLNRLGLKSSLKDIMTVQDLDDLMRAMSKDKKKRGGTLEFILLEDFGKPVIEKIKIQELEKTMTEILEED